jgi:arabinofuranosyltransferase
LLTTLEPRPLTRERLVLLIASLFLAHVFYLRGAAEDTFIALRFASNLAHGHGLVWNPGLPPVEGYTDFLWVVLCAAAIKLGIPGLAFAQGLSIACGVAIVLLTYTIGRRVMEWPSIVAAVPAALLAASGPLATWSSSGMESTLFTLLILIATHQLAWSWRTYSSSAMLLASVALLLSTLTRPEGLMIAGLLLGLSALVALVRSPRLLGSLALAIGLFAVGFSLYFAWRYARYGYVMPNTYYAKTGGGIGQILRGGLLAYLFLMQFAVPLMPGVLLALWENGLPSVAAVRADPAGWFRRQAFSVFAAVICIAYTANNILVGGDYMAMHRFFVPVLPFMYLLFGHLIAAVHARMTRPENRVGLAALVTFVLAATFFPSTVLERSFFASPPQQHGDYRGVQIERWHVARLSVIGQFFQTYRRDPAESLATTAIGAIGYYSEMRIYDIHGLVDTHIAHLPPPPNFAKARPGHGRSDLPYTFSLQPTYVMFSRDLTPQPIELWMYVPPALRAAVDRDYVHQSVRLVDERNGENGYFTFFERRDSARRRDPA